MSQLLLLLVIMVSAYGAKACSMTDDVCEFWFVVENRMTMMNGGMLVKPDGGYIYNYDVVNTSNATPVDVDDVITADGFSRQRRVAVINGTMPGPAIEVYENQEVIVHVRSKLILNGLSIHWHGLHQQGTPWMDGVAYVTQCPIMPGQSFTYKFKAYPRGTFWYHSHIGVQRTMGVFGPVIIREKRELEMEEFILTLQDWNHDMDSTTGYISMVKGLYVDGVKYTGTHALDGGKFSLFAFDSGLINGRGRYHTPGTGEHNGAPLETFMVEQGMSYRFRVISAGGLYPFLVSIDNHPMTIVASDGFDLVPVTVEAFIINPGERFDFVIHANESVANYWIRAVTLEVGVNHIAEAILRYTGSNTGEPTTTRPVCTENNTCTVLNCPFTYFPRADYTTCIRFDHLRSNGGQSAPVASGNSFKEVFLNFAFPGYDSYPGSINGRAFVPPTVSALTQPGMGMERCDPTKCGEQKVCHCTYSLDLSHDDVVQMVFLNMGSGKGWSHPIHLHGHSFYVLKMGYARYNETSGQYLGENMDIDCRGGVDRKDSFCNDATWSNSSWLQGNVPGLELDSPPRKDTLIVPTGGYSVVRIKADNPGLWTMHCHIEIHNQDGMLMVVNESFSRQPAPPKGFPVCGSFSLPLPELQENVTTNIQQNVTTTMMPQMSSVYTEKLFWIVVGSLIGFVCVLIFIIIHLCCMISKSNLQQQYAVNNHTWRTVELDNKAFVAT